MSKPNATNYLPQDVKKSKGLPRKPKYTKTGDKKRDKAGNNIKAGKVSGIGSADLGEIGLFKKGSFRIPDLPDLELRTLRSGFRVATDISR